MGRVGAELRTPWTTAETWGQPEKKDGFIVRVNSLTEKTGEDIPGVGIFFDHANGDILSVVV